MTQVCFDTSSEYTTRLNEAACHFLLWLCCSWLSVHHVMAAMQKLPLPHVDLVLLQLQIVDCPLLVVLQSLLENSSILSEEDSKLHEDVRRLP